MTTCSHVAEYTLRVATSGRGRPVERLCGEPIKGSGPCKTCEHSENLHHAEGFYDEVTEPEYRPTKPECEMCSIERLYLSDTKRWHVYEPTVFTCAAGHVQEVPS